MDKFTPRVAAKYVANTIVAVKSKQVAENVITDHTEFEKDDLIVKIGSGLISGYVASTVRPLTDAAVDKTADYIVAKREARAAKKNKTKETE